MLRLALCLALVACTRVAAPPPAAPRVATPVATPQPSTPNQAVEFAMSWLPKIDPAVKCWARSGRDTFIASAVDTATCTLATVMMNCSAPADGKSTCAVVADWSPPKPAEVPTKTDPSPPAPVARKAPAKH